MAQRKFPDWATVLGVLSNGDSSRVDPGQPKQDSGWIIEKPLVQSMNWLQNLFGHFIRANNEVKVKADLYEAEAGEIVTLDNSSGAVTGYLPANPVDGQWVVFGGVGLFSVFGVTIDGSGNNIMVAADTSCVLDEDGTMYKFYWRDSESMWKINKYEVVGVV